MSKLSAIILTTLCTVFWLGLSRADMSIIGTWSGIDSDGDSATFVFNEDKSAEVKLEGVPLLSSKTMTNGNVEWFRNRDHDPMHLDIVIIVGTEEKGRIRMLAQFVDARTLKLQISRDMTSRPGGFAMTDEVFQIQVSKQ